VILPRVLDTRVLFNILVALVRRGHSKDAREKLQSACVDNNLRNFHSEGLQGLTRGHRSLGHISPPDIAALSEVPLAGVFGVLLVRRRRS
jgi:hypothetical protein